MRSVGLIVVILTEIFLSTICRAGSKEDLELLDDADRLHVTLLDDWVETDGKRAATIKNKEDIRRIISLLTLKRVEPTAGEDAATLHFYQGKKLLRKVWIFESGEWGFIGGRKSLGQNQHLFDELKKIVKSTGTKKTSQPEEESKYWLLPGAIVEGGGGDNLSIGILATYTDPEVICFCEEERDKGLVLPAVDIALTQHYGRNQGQSLDLEGKVYFPKLSWISARLAIGKLRRNDGTFMNQQTVAIGWLYLQMFVRHREESAFGIGIHFP